MHGRPASRFEAAVANSKSLSERPDNATLLKIYALYKQATSGDDTEKKPGFGDMVGRAKWDAWNGLKGRRRRRHAAVHRPDPLSLS